MASINWKWVIISAQTVNPVTILSSQIWAAVVSILVYVLVLQGHLVRIICQQKWTRHRVPCVLRGTIKVSMGKGRVMTFVVLDTTHWQGRQFVSPVPRVHTRPQWGQRLKRFVNRVRQEPCQAHMHNRVQIVSMAPIPMPVDPQSVKVVAQAGGLVWWQVNVWIACQENITMESRPGTL